MKRIWSIAVSFLLLLTVFSFIDMQFEISRPVRGAVVYVGGTGPGNLSTIQAGINAANPGDTVFIYNGTYNETVVVTKTINLTGEDMNSTIIINPLYDLMFGTVISVQADWVNITGFTLRKGWHAGVDIDGYSNITVAGNNITDCAEGGIVIFNVSENRVLNNIFTSNGFGGVYIKGDFRYTTILENIVSSNTFFNDGGVYLQDTYGNDVFNNTFTNNSVGVYLDHANWANITNNYMINNNNGIVLWRFCDGHNMSGNIFSNNFYGIYFIDTCQDNYIVSNHFEGNDNGIYFTEGPDNDDNYVFHNNFINNANQSKDGGLNYWNLSYPSGGNFWSDYNGTDYFSGPNQDIPGSDGIGDTPYYFNMSFWRLTDYYPFMEPFGNFTYLRHGWNPISIPWIQPSTKLEDVLDQINGTYKAVQWFNASDKKDPWKHYSVSKPSHLNDLHIIDHTMGLQIYVDDPGGAVLEFSGIPPTQNQATPLYKGWNMVGYPSLSNKYRPDALNNLVFGTEVDAVWTYNSGAKKWEEVEELNYFVVGKGYWIHATQDCVWEVPL